MSSATAGSTAIHKVPEDVVKVLFWLEFERERGCCGS